MALTTPTIWIGLTYLPGPRDIFRFQTQRRISLARQARLKALIAEAPDILEVTVSDDQVTVYVESLSVLDAAQKAAGTSFHLDNAMQYVIVSSHQASVISQVLYLLTQALGVAVRNVVMSQTGPVAVRAPLTPAQLRSDAAKLEEKAGTQPSPFGDGQVPVA